MLLGTWVAPRQFHLASSGAGPMSRPPVSALERFESKFIPEPNSGCWLWQAATSRRYGAFSVDGRTVTKAHRASWLLYNGPITDEMFVLHHCDTPVCVNPDHLFLGSQAENMADKTRKGRAKKRNGVRYGGAKLTPDLVMAIRNDKRRGPEVAAGYGVTDRTIRKIRTNATWHFVGMK